MKYNFTDQLAWQRTKLEVSLGVPMKWKESFWPGDNVAEPGPVSRDKEGS